jgi:hypothetical protein
VIDTCQKGGHLEHLLRHPATDRGRVIFLAFSPEQRNHSTHRETHTRHSCYSSPAPQSPRFPRRPKPVDPALAPDAGNDFFLRGKNLYDSAQAATDLDNRIDLYQRAAQIFAEYLTAFPNHPNAEWRGGIWATATTIRPDRGWQTLFQHPHQPLSARANGPPPPPTRSPPTTTTRANTPSPRRCSSATPPTPRNRRNARAEITSPEIATACLGRDREAITAFNMVIEDPAGGLFAPQSKVALGHLSLKAGKLRRRWPSSRRCQFALHAQSPRRGRAACRAHRHQTRQDRSRRPLPRPDPAHRRAWRTSGGRPDRADGQSFREKGIQGSHQRVPRQHDQGRRRQGSRPPDDRRPRPHAPQATERGAVLFREVERLVKPESDWPSRRPTTACCASSNRGPPRAGPGGRVPPALPESPARRTRAFTPR